MRRPEIKKLPQPLIIKVSRLTLTRFQMSAEKVVAPAAPGTSIKYAALLTLVLQNSLLILTMRYSRIMDTDEVYISSTAVLLNEVIKLVISLLVSFKEAGVKQTFAEVFGEGHWMLAVPAALYTLQNSMQYVAASNLDAATFQVTYQLKILSTAFFAVTILHKRLHINQWAALGLLTMGVAVVQLPTSIVEVVKGFIAPIQDVETPAEDRITGVANNIRGLVAVTIACVLSGLAGIYFEKVLKGSRSVSLWVRNVQLSFYSLFPALFIGVLAKDGREISAKGFFYGYNMVVVSVILLQAGGGIVVALCVKYADNIAKNFATSISILVSAIASVYFFGTTLTTNFAVGASIVILATWLYSKYERK